MAEVFTVSPPQPAVQNTCLRLNIGGGAVELPGYVNVDRKKGMEAYPLAFESGTAEEIYASHVLEHFPHHKVEAVVAEWVRVLKPGGRLRIAVPDFGKLCEMYAEGQPANYQGYVMGGHTDDDDKHGAVFDFDGLRIVMQKAGLVAVRRFDAEYQDCSALPISLNMQGEKPTERAEMAWISRNCHAVMSAPRLGFTDHHMCNQTALIQAGMGLTITQGAFWGQCLENTIEEVIDAGKAEWILTLDNDTIFTADTLRRMAILMDTHPEVDALAPIQIKRDDQCPLLNCGETRTGSYFADDVAEVDWAHFGCTLIRVEAIKKMRKPWFWAEPNKEGKWGPGKTDEDIGFWKNFRGAGNRVFVACRVPVGHLQLMVTWPDETMRPIHQFSKDFRAHGMPKGVRN